MQRETMTGREAEYRPDHREQEAFTELLRELADEGTALVRHEVTLAKLELKQTAAAIARDGVRLGIGIGLALVGGLALTAFLILVLGALLDGAYWAGALIVGAVFVLVGGILAWTAMSNLREQEVMPDETIDTLNEDKRWLQREARDFRREAMS
ncbi:MAG: phage holin family protein [Gammaproteobacteria bacterium]|nr:phage holin family protein [Gammaproteobacteria bacterium]